MENTQIKYYIEADGELRREIARLAGVSLPAVSKALNYSAEMNAKTAHRIRVIALEHGAVKMEVKVANTQKA